MEYGTLTLVIGDGTLMSKPHIIQQLYFTFVMEFVSFYDFHT